MVFVWEWCIFSLKTLSWAHLGHLWAVLDVFWGALGAVWGSFAAAWGHPVPVLCCLGLTGPLLELFWEGLWLSSGSLGALLGCLGALLGSPGALLGCLWEPKSMKNQHFLWFFDFYSHLLSWTLHSSANLKKRTLSRRNAHF